MSISLYQSIQFVMFLCFRKYVIQSLGNGLFPLALVCAWTASDPNQNYIVSVSSCHPSYKDHCLCHQIISSVTQGSLFVSSNHIICHTMITVCVIKSCHLIHCL